MESSTQTPHHWDQPLKAHQTFGIGKGLRSKAHLACRLRIIREVSSKKCDCSFKILSKKQGGDFKKSAKPRTSQEISRENEASELPLELIGEHILVRLPIKSLLRFKSVSKKWCLLIEDRWFIQKQMSRSEPLVVRDCDEITDSGTLIQSHCNSKGFWGYEIIGVFDGLVVQRIWDKYFVKNPATLQILSLPQPLGQIHRVWFDLDPISGDAKLLCEYRVMAGDFVLELGFQVLTIEKDEQWRRIPTPSLGGEGKENLLMALGPRNLHFLSLARTGLRVDSFDVRSERFTSNDLPRGLVAEGPSRACPFWWEESLAVAEFAGSEKLRFTVLEDRRWSEPREVRLSFLRERMFSEEKLVPVSAKSGELWFHYDGVCKFSYDVKTGKLKERGILANETRPVSTFEYRPSLRSLKGMRPIIGFWNLPKLRPEI